MSPRRILPLLAASALLGVPALVFAQRTELDQLRKPTTVPQFWAAMKGEITQGKFDVAAEYLKGLLALNPSDKDLLTLEERDGLAAFLDLNNIPRWSNNAEVDKEAKDNVTKLIGQMTAAVKKLRSDPDRIQKFIRNLTASPEERDYAFLELRKGGAAVMPQLIGTIQNSELRERAALIAILPKLEPETVPPLLAAFDINNSTIRVELINVLQARADLLTLQNRTMTDPRPTLWKLSAGNDLVASKAKTLLAAMTRIPLARLPLAVGELIRVAEEIYQHRNTLAKESNLTLWKWDGRQMTGTPATPTQAEEYLGLRYARWALELQPANEAAQVTFLSIATEKAMERGGVDSRLTKSSPAVHELLASASSNVLYRMLERGLAENHLMVALGAIQVIGERAEIHGKSGIEPLVKALGSQDRRVALAAADALIRMPNNAGAAAAARIVEVYRGALATPPGAGSADGTIRRPRALVADSDELRTKLTAEVIEQAGFDTVVAYNGRDALRRLGQGADIDVIWVNHGLLYPQLRDFLAQARGDFRYGKLPLFVIVAEDGRKAEISEILLMLEKLESRTRDWLLNPDELGAETKAAMRAMNGESRLQVSERRRLVIDRSRYPVRVDFKYDALRLNAAETEFLNSWLIELGREHPGVRQTKWEAQRVNIAISNRNVAGLEDRLKNLNAGLEQVVSRRVSETLLVLDLPSADLPDMLTTRIAELLRDFQFDVSNGVRSQNLHVSREIPTTISLTSRTVPPPQQTVAPGIVAAAVAPVPPAIGPKSGTVEVVYNPELEEDKIRRAVPAATVARLRTLLANYRNVALIGEPLNANDVRIAMKRIEYIAGPTMAPLSEVERKDHQRRAVDALRQMATGSIPGYDVRPATREILDAIRDNDLASAAIEAAGRLPGKDVQVALAEALVNTARLAPIRKQAAEELVRNIQKFGPTSITDAQIGALIKLMDEEKNADVKAGIGVVLGALPRERIVHNITDPKAQEAWDRRLLNYQPSPAVPAPAAPPKAEDK